MKCNQLTVLLIAVCQPAAQCGTGLFNVDAAGVVSRSDVVLQRPNIKPEEAMPLGNGRLGVAVWSENGLTLQLNRADTLPHRLSPGQVVLPGLKPLANDRDYAGRLDLHRGEFREQGGGLKAVAYVQPDSDIAVVDVIGANPNSPQTAILYLWQPRKANATVHGAVAALSETWKDTGEAGASGDTFGSLGAITADARDLHAEVQNRLSVKLSFRPKSDSSFRLFIAAPEWKGGDSEKPATELLATAAATPAARHQSWWNDFWQQAGLMKMASEDGSVWIWRQYLATQDRAFLASNYPVMAASARFLLAYTRTGASGMLHMFPSNAHENQWDVHDPTTDLSAMKSFFPAVISAARILHNGLDARHQLGIGAYSSAGAAAFGFCWRARHRCNRTIL